MKYRTSSVVAAGLIASVGLVGAAQAETLLYQTDFENPPFALGDLVGQGGWAAHSGTGSAIQVVTGSSQAVELVQGSGSRQDANVDLGHTLGAGEAFTFSFDVIINGIADASTVYFAHFKDDGTGFNSRIFVTAPNTASQNFTFGIGETSSSTIASTFASDFVFGQLYTLSGSYDFDTGISLLTVDGFGTIDSTSQADPGEDLSAFAFRQSGGNTSMIIDNLSVGLVTPVPVPAAAWLLGSALLGLAGLRKRRDG